jgi:glutamate synthase (NADPH) large chain
MPSILGLLKIMSKMGIATIASYRNSGLFDVMGLSREIVHECFGESHAMIPGLTYEDIDGRLERNHKEAFEVGGFNTIFPLKIGGYYKFYNGQEHHDFNPDVIHAIHRVAKTGKREDFDRLSALINGRGQKFIRDFFEFKSDRPAIDVSEVEPKEAIF